MADISSIDENARQIYMRSRMGFLFIIWAVAMRCFRSL
jgi:hypothetical protein